MPLVHKSGGFVVNLYEGEDLFAIARDRCQKFSHFLDNHEKSWQQKSQMVNRSPTITSTFPEELNILMTMMMIMVTMLNILTTIIRAASHLGFQEKL